MRSDGSDTACFSDEGFPGVAASVDDSVVGVEDTPCQIVLAQVLPDIFLSVEFRAIGRQAKKREIIGNDKLSCSMPACSVDNDDGVASLLNMAADFLEMKVHGLGVDVGHDQSRPRITRRTYGDASLFLPRRASTSLFGRHAPHLETRFQGLCFWHELEEFRLSSRRSFPVFTRTSF